MPMITTCIEPGCATLCMGLFCIKHDVVPVVDFPRGRPWPPASRALAAPVLTVAEPIEPALVSIKPAA